MNIGKILYSIFMGLRKIGFAIFGKFFKKVTDATTGKDVFFKDKRNLKRTGLSIVVVLFIGVIFYKMFNTDINPVDGYKDYTSELKGKMDVNAPEILVEDAEIDDPLKNILGENDNQLLNKKFDKNGEEAPDRSVCLELLEKLKKGDRLNLDEKKDLKYCLDNNSTLGLLSPEDLDLANKLLEDTVLSEAEKQMLRELFGEEKECQAEFDNQMANTEGNAFLTKIINDPKYNEEVVNLLKNQSLLKRMVLNEKMLMNKIGLNQSEVNFLKNLLEKCSTELLLKMLTDPKYREIMKKLLKAAGEDPNLISSLLGKDDLTDEERKLLQKLLEGTLTSPDDEIAEALLDVNPIKQKLASDILKARSLGDEDLAQALTKKLTGDILNDEDKALLDKFDSDALSEAYIAQQKGDDDLAQALLKKAKGEGLTSDEEKLLKTEFRADNDKDLMKQLAEDLARRQAAIDKLNEELRRAKALAKDAATKLANGDRLTPEEQDMLAKYAELQNKLNELQKLQDARKKQLLGKYAEYQNFLNQLGETVSQTFPTGVTVFDDVNLKKCSDIPPFNIVRLVKPKKTRKVVRSKTVTKDGRELTPEELELLQIVRKQKADEQNLQRKNKQEMFNALAGSFLDNSSPINQNTAQSNQNGNQGIGNLVVAENDDLKPFKLTPDMAFPGLLMTQILVTDQGASQQVKVKILRDIYEPTTGKLAIPKNSIAIGRTGSFDPQTGIMNLTLTQVINGGKVYDVEFSVGSGDMTPGLSGEVRDTRGKFLAGAFISSFSAGALGAVSQNFIAPFQDSELLDESLTGAALQGTAEIAQQIAELYAGDLQNAARIFYVPANYPVVLVPNGN